MFFWYFTALLFWGLALASAETNTMLTGIFFFVGIGFLVLGGITEDDHAN